MHTGSTRTTYARQLPPRRGMRSWWGKAWQRAVEEAAYSDAELKPGRAAARRGDVGGITVDAGSLLAAVRAGDDAWTVEVVLPTLDGAARSALVDVVAAEAGRIVALLAGDLPHALVEHAEEAGVELLPYGGELAASCTCPHYIDPCPHALATLTQAGWLVDADPLVLFALRGLDRDTLRAELDRRTPSPSGGLPTSESGSVPLVDDVEIAVDAALRARAMLESFEHP